MSDERTITDDQRAFLRSMATDWVGAFAKLQVFGLPVSECDLSSEEMVGVTVLLMRQRIDDQDEKRQCFANERVWLRQAGSIA